MDEKITESLEHFKVFVEREIILKEGNENENIYIINQGIIAIHKNIKGKVVLLGLLGKGRIFGGSILFDISSKVPYTAIALEDCRILVFDKKEYVSIYEKERDISFETFKQLDYNYISVISKFSELLEKDEISCMVDSFLEYRILKDESVQSTGDLNLSVELISAITGVKAEDLEGMIDRLLKMNILYKKGDSYLLSSREDMEKCLQILKMKKRSAGMLV